MAVSGIKLTYRSTTTHWNALTDLDILVFWKFKPLFTTWANNVDPDQPVHSFSLLVDQYVAKRTQFGCAPVLSIAEMQRDNSKPFTSYNTSVADDSEMIYVQIWKMLINKSVIIEKT